MVILSKVKLFTNPGSNLSPAAVLRYGFALSAQQIVVDGVQHDMRQHRSLDDVDRWVASARDFPHVVGTTAADMMDLYLEALKQERELLTIATSRKIIRSYDAARSAAGTLAAHPRYADASIEIVDTMTTDIGAALICLAVGEAARANWSFAETIQMASEMSKSGSTVLYIQDLGRLVRGGRAGQVRSWLANRLGLRPLVGFVDGELAPIGTVRDSDDPSAMLVDGAIRRFGEGRAVWIAVNHGGSPEQVPRCVEACRRKLDVRYVYTRALSSGVYLHCGRGSLGLSVVPIDGLARVPPVPPQFDDA